MSIPYMGGKHNLARWIIKHYPEHKIYVEPFGGAAHVLLKKEPSGLEVYNDINEEMVNVFKVLQDKDKTKRLTRLLQISPYSRRYFYQVRENEYKVPDPAGDLIKAYRTLLLIKQSFAGNAFNRRASWGYDKTKRSQVTSFYNFLVKLQNVVERFRKVQIEFLDFRDCIKRYDSTDTLYYCDPPYYQKEFYYVGGFGKQEHIDLANLLNGIKGKAIVSYYKHPEVLKLYKGWNIKEKLTVKASHKVKNGAPKQKATELLIMNFNPEV